MKLNRPRILILLGLCAALVAVLIIVLTPAPDHVPMPDPNGYDDFVKAGAMLRGNIGDFPELDRESLAELIATNSQTLALGQAG